MRMKIGPWESTIENIRSMKGDARKLDFPDEYFDKVISIETIEHLNEGDQEKFINEIKRILKPNGILILSTPDRYVVGRQGMNYGDFHEKEFTKKELLDFLNKNKLGDLEVYGQGKFSEPNLVRLILNFIKHLDIFNFRKSVLLKNFTKKMDKLTSPIKFDYKLYKMTESGALASHIIVICKNIK